MHTFFIPQDALKILISDIDLLTRAHFRATNQPRLADDTVTEYAEKLLNNHGIPLTSAIPIVKGFSARSAMRIVAQNPV